MCAARPNFLWHSDALCATEFQAKRYWDYDSGILFHDVYRQEMLTTRLPRIASENAQERRKAMIVEAAA